MERLLGHVRDINIFLYTPTAYTLYTRDEDPDPLIFVLPDPLLFSLDSDPNCKTTDI